MQPNLVTLSLASHEAVVNSRFLFFASLHRRNERKSSFDVHVIEKSFILNLLGMGQKISALVHSMNFAVLQINPLFIEIKPFTKEGNQA